MPAAAAVPLSKERSGHGSNGTAEAGDVSGSPKRGHRRGGGKAGGASPGGAEELRRLALKKRVWQLRVCERLAVDAVAATLAEEEAESGQPLPAGALEPALITLYVEEIEKFRATLDVHWTFFEEELMNGEHDAEFLPSQKRRGTAAPPPEQFPGQEAEEPPPKLTIPPPEVRKAAEERRRVNRFSPLFFHDDSGGLQREAAAGCGGLHVLCAILELVEVRDALHVGFASRGFRGLLFALDGDGRKSDPATGAEGVAQGWTFWRLVGSRQLVLQPAEGVRRAGEQTDPSLAPFAGDLGFSWATWARRRAFAARLAARKAAPAVVVQPGSDLTLGPGGELGPFLPVGGCSAERLVPGRLLLADGKQSFQVVDVERRGVEEVLVDRYANMRKLHSSMRGHATAVTASWPMEAAGHWCAVAGGVLVGWCEAKGKGQALQWLELPSFAESGEVASATSCTAAPRSQVAGPSPAPSKKAHPLGSPTIRAAPKASHKSSPARGGAGAPLLGALQKLPMLPPAASGEPASHCGGAGLVRIAVGQERLLASLGAGASRCAVERIWALPADGSPSTMALVLLRVSSTLGAPSGGLSPSGGASPSMGPSPAPTMPLSRAVSGDSEQAVHSWSLQVWDFHIAAAPQRLAAASVPSPVVAVDIADSQDAAACFLCRMASGGLEVFSLPSSHGEERTEAVEVRPLQRLWQTDDGLEEVRAGGSATSNALLLRGSSEASDFLAVVAQTSRVLLCSSCHEPQLILPLFSAAGQLPAEQRLRVAALQRVGRSGGFAVCTDARAYAFEVPAGVTSLSDTAGSVVLTAVVELSSIARLVPERPLRVRHFQATPYEFVAVAEDGGAICCLWPPSVRSTGGATARAAAPGNSSDQEESGPTRDFRAWSRSRQQGTSSGLVPTQVTAFSLNALLGRLDGLCQDPGATSLGVGSAVFSCGLASDACTVTAQAPLLAIAATGYSASLVVFHWGVEANAEVPWLQRRRQELLEEAAKKQELERIQLQLQRSQQKLQDIYKLEDRAKEKGLEALTEEERAKIGRREEVLHTCERLVGQLGLRGSDAAAAVGERSSGEEESDDRAQLPIEQQLIARRRDKEKQHKLHHESKKAMQKERQKLRERKYVE